MYILYKNTKKLILKIILKMYYCHQQKKPIMIEMYEHVMYCAYDILMRLAKLSQSLIVYHLLS
jgi:hypothetical protein